MFEFKTDGRMYASKDTDLLFLDESDDMEEQSIRRHTYYPFAARISTILQAFFPPRIISA
ncbi:MAG: hypothetical protein ACLRSW_13995 [Christensenellaceae bacterium]